MRVYLDTSLLVAVYVPETLTGKVLQLLKEPIIVFISSLVEVEFYSALSRKLRMGELRASQCRRITGLFDRHGSSRSKGAQTVNARSARKAQSVREENESTWELYSIS